MEKIKIGITQGDINGTNYEVIIKALSDNQIFDFCTPIIYGSSKAASYYKKMLDAANFNLNLITEAKDAQFKKINMINCADEELKVELAKQSPESEAAAISALENAVKDLKGGHIDVLVTAPMHLQSINSEKFQFAGHTDYLASKWDKKDEALLLLVHEKIKIATLTAPVPLSKVPSLITHDNIVQKVKTLSNVLTQDFAIRKPRIAVLGLNPDAGTSNILRTEESEIISPALTQLNKEGYICVGPLKADDLFASDYFTHFDAVLAMYHDQAMIPFKAITQNEGIIFSANLPIIRTAPIHGTDYEIAGKNIASGQSLRNAMYQAYDILKSRRTHQQINANPLNKQKFD